MKKIKALQGELWHNCNVNCDFCYLKKNRIISSTEEKIANIQKFKNIISVEGKEYNAIGLIGGEFFQGQLKGCKKEFLDLINFIYSQENIEEVWLTASLIDKNQDDLFETLSRCTNKRTLICTSYDTIGRFKSEEQHMQWFDNVNILLNMHFDVHSTIIITQDFIDKVLLDSTWLRKIPGSVDFRFPTIFWSDFQHIKNKGINRDSYRQVLKENLKLFPNKWYIENRMELFKCLNILKNIYGKEKLYALQSNEVRSDKLYYLAPDAVLNGRWDPTNIEENAPCGHPWSNSCYLNDERCIQCDVLHFYAALS